jgi:hypothetical protein
MDTQLTGQLSQEEINSLKQKYPQGIYSIEVDGHIAYFKNPTRLEMNCAMSKASAEAAFDIYDELTKRTLIGGSEEVLTDDQKFFGVVHQVKVKMEGKKASLVNL